MIGVKYYDTKVDNPDKVFTWEFGSGQFSPAVEEALVGVCVLIVLLRSQLNANFLDFLLEKMTYFRCFTR